MRIITCLLCEKEKKHYAKNLCENCYAKKQYKKFCEKKKTYQRKYHHKNKENCNRKSKEYRKNNLESIKRYDRQRYQKNKVKKLEYQKGYAQNNKKKIKIYKKRYFKENRKKINKWHREYYSENPEVKLKYKARELAYKKITKNPICCEKCGEKTEKLERHHKDYLKPLEIIWLCKNCHRIEDKNMKNGNKP